MEAVDMTTPMLTLMPMDDTSRLARRYPLIPRDTLEQLVRWCEGKHPYPFGSFVMAVLANDLMLACHYADDHNRTALYEYAKFLYNEAPGVCYGTHEKVRAWLLRQQDDMASVQP